MRRLSAHLEAIVHESTLALEVLDDPASLSAIADRREVKRRVLVIRDEAQRLLDSLSETGREEPEN